MRLNQRDKDIIVSRIIDDVPVVNYTDQVHKLVREHFKAKLPPDVAKMLRDPKLAQHITKSQIWINGFPNVYVDGGFDRAGSNSYMYPPEEMEAQIEAIRKLSVDQSDQIKSIKRKLETAFSAVNTRKQAAELFPEFEKYLPPEEFRLRNLPITTDVIPALTEAGWPKGQKPVAKARGVK